MGAAGSGGASGMAGIRQLVAESGLAAWGQQARQAALRSHGRPCVLDVLWSRAPSDTVKPLFLCYGVALPAQGATLLKFRKAS